MIPAVRSLLSINAFIKFAATICFLLIPSFLTNTYYLHLVNLILVYSVVSIGLNIATGFVGEISLGHAAFLGIGAYVSAFITTNLHLSFWIGLPVAVVVSSLLGALVGYFTLHLEGPYLAMATIGIGIIVQTILVNWIAFSGGPSGMEGIPSIQIGPLSFDSEGKFYYLALITCAVIYWISHRLIHSNTGRIFIAVREKEGAAKSLGINTTFYKVLAFTISTAMAGLSGSLLAHWTNYINPDSFAFNQSLLFMTMIMIGGLGSLPGAVLGTALLVILSEGLRSLQDYRMIVYAVLIILVVTFLKKGIIGLFPEKYRGNGTFLLRDLPESNAFNTDSKHLSVAIADQSNAEPVLEVSQITKKFGGLAALTGLDITLKPDTIHALIGPNGSGKTTLLNLLAGWYRPESGHISFRGQDITRLSTHQRAQAGIARTFQNILLFKSMTALENVLVGLSAGSHSKESSVSQARDILEFVGMSTKLNTVVTSLSYGEQRKVEIARALATKPKLLLLDEPAAGMNHSETSELMDLLRRIRGFGITILIVEHDMRLVMGVADQITVLSQGKKLAEGGPLEVSRNPAVIEAYLGKGGVAFAGN